MRKISVSKGEKHIKKILGLAVFVIVMALVYGGLFLYNRPLGQALELDIPEEIAQTPPPRARKTNRLKSRREPMGAKSKKKN